MRRIISGLIMVLMTALLMGCQGSGHGSTDRSAVTDAPVLKDISISAGSDADQATASGDAHGTAVDYYAGPGESISFRIELTNPSKYSISRFKINGTEFTTGSFTSDPIQPGQTTTVIHTSLIPLGTTFNTETFSISDIKYVSGIGGERDAAIKTDSVSSTRVMTGFSGSGTASDPYLIENAGQLKAVGRCTNGNIGGVDGYNGKYLKLTADIDLSGVDWVPVGTYRYDSVYSHCFRGTFDGGGKTIRNVSINSSLLRDIGLFGYVYGGTIKNTVLVNSHMTNATFNGTAGGIAGSLVNGFILNCSNSGNVRVASSSSYSGGIAGYTLFSTVSGCSNSATVSSGTSSAVDHMSAGGIVGMASGTCTIQDSFNAGSVNATGSTYNESGGIIGKINNGTVSNCYNIGTVSVTNTGFSYCTTGAGIAGVNGGSMTNCMWLEGSAGVISCVGAGTVSASKTAADMKMLSLYSNAGWDFDTVWKISTGEFPKLIWQN